MTITELLDRLIAGTENDTIEWDYVGSSKYRYVSDRAAVTINQYNGSNYTVQLFDEDNCFATYYSTSTTEIADKCHRLYQAIIDSIRRATERKIGNLFGSL